MITKRQADCKVIDKLLTVDNTKQKHLRMSFEKKGEM